MTWLFLVRSQASAGSGYGRTSALLTLLVALLLGTGLVRPAPAAVEVLAAPDLGLMVGGGVVLAIARQSDGKLIIGGAFDIVDGVPRRNIARLNADGSLDTTWNPGTSGLVKALAVDSSNHVYVGGQFTTLGGVSRNNIARLNADGSLDATWNPGASNVVNALAVDGSNHVYVGGSFNFLGGQFRNNIARLNADGSLDATWNPGVNNVVNALAVDGSNNVYVGGQFTTLGGVGRNSIARVTSAGAVDSWNPGVSGLVLALAVDGSNNVYVGGFFTALGGQSRNRIARVTSAGAIDTSWYPGDGANGAVNALAVDGSNNVYVGGQFTTLGGVGRNRIARVTSAGTVDGWYPTGGANSEVNALAVDSSDNVYVGGRFTTLGGSTHLSLAVADKTLGTPTANSVHVGPAGTVRALARDSVGRLVVGGLFNGVRGGIGRDNLLRLNADGSLDATWNPGANGAVSALAVDGSNNVYVGGQFTTLGGQSRNSIARVTSAGAVDTSWYPGDGANGAVYALAVDGSNNVYVGGQFTALGGASRNNIARVTSAGAADTSWYPGNGANGAVYALAVDGSNNVYVGGQFTTLGGANRNYIARVTSAGAVDGWYPGSADRAVYALAVDGSNNVYVGGQFTTLGGAGRNYIARVTSAGAVDGWNPGGGANNNAVYALAVDGSNHVYVGGGFTTLGGAGRNYIARVTSAGTVDGWYPPGGASNWVYALAVDGSNHVYVGGQFTTLGGQSRAMLAALATSRLAVVAVNGGTAPAVNTPFAVALQLQDSAQNPVTVATATPVQLSVQTGAGVLGGTTACTIAVDASGCTVSGLTYSQVETGVILRATATGGDVADPGDSAPFDVVKATPTLGLDRTPDRDSLPDEVVDFTATVAATPPTTGTPSGTVTFNDGTTPLCANVALSGGNATCASVLNLGSHSLTAVYSGDANFTGGTSVPLTHNVNQAPAITSAAAATFTVGQASSFTATATGTPAPTLSYSGALPSGVSFTNGTLSGTPAAGTENTYPLVLTASNGVNPAATQNFTLTVQGSDNDNDGYSTPDDCNDNDADIHPGATEICDRKDNDCNPTTAERCPLGCPQL